MLGIVVKGYPRLSETFIAREVAHIARTWPCMIVALRRPVGLTPRPEVDVPVIYLPEYLYQEPLRVLRGWWHSRRQPGYRRALGLFWRDLRRDPTPNRVRRWGQSLVLVQAMAESGVGALYSHFLHTPSSVARYGALMAQVPWGAAAHARDIWISPRWDLAEKLALARFCLVCTRTHALYLSTLLSEGERHKVVHSYHGVDLSMFPAPAAVPAPAARPPAEVTIVSVGRMVPKKGFGDLLAALALLSAGLRWRFEHIGAGPLERRLKAQARRLKLDVTWHGAQPPAVVLERLRAADIFVLASQPDRDGDRDGLPNVLLEAQSQKLPVVATRLGSIMELIEHERNGLLVNMGNPPELAAALSRLIEDQALRQRLGQAGYEIVHRDFDERNCIPKVLEVVGELQAGQAPCDG